MQKTNTLQFLKIDELQKQLAKLFADLEGARGIETDATRVVWFADKLVEMHYTQAHFNAAKMWILCGDWTFRGVNAKVEFSDFFPSEKQATSNVPPDFVIIKRAEFISKIRASYDNGFRDGQNHEEKTRGKETVSWDETQKKSFDVMIKTVKKVNEKNERLAMLLSRKEAYNKCLISENKDMLLKFGKHVTVQKIIVKNNLISYKKRRRK